MSEGNMVPRKSDYESEPDPRNILARSKDKIGAHERVKVDGGGNASRAVSPDSGNGLSLTNSGGGTMIVRMDTAP
jgi:hypothetical protein